MTPLHCQNSECRRLLMEAEGNDFRIRVKCRRCKRESIFTPSREMLKQDASKASSVYEEAFQV